MSSSGHLLKKAQLVTGFFDANEDDEPLGHFSLKDLPERFFRDVVAAHNTSIDSVLEVLPDSWNRAATEMSALRIPTYEDFQARLGDSRQRSTVAVEYRKARDFETYRGWVLGQEPIATTFRETFFGKRFPGHVPRSKRARHALVVGRSGSGKSETLSLLAIDAKTRQGQVRRDESLVVIDPHGDLALHVARQQHYWDDYRRCGSDADLIYLDPLLDPVEKSFPTLNPLDIESKELSDVEIEKHSQQVARVFESLISGDSQLTLNMRTLLVPCITVLLHRPGSTFHDLLRFLSPDRHRDLVELGRHSRNEAQRSFFEGPFLERRWIVTKGALATKVQSLLNHRVFAQFIARPRSTVDLERELNTGKTIILNCAKGRVGDEISEAMGRFVVGMVMSVAFNREKLPASRRVPTWMIIDEAQNFVGDEIETILAETRKYTLHLTLATQVVGQRMSPQVTRVVLGNTGVQMVGSAGADSLNIMAKEMQCPVRTFHGLEVGEFVVKAGAAPPVRLRMRSDYLGARNHMDTAQWRELQEFQLRRHYRTGGPAAPDGEAGELLPEEPKGGRGGFTSTALTSPSTIELGNPFADLED